MKTSIAAVNSRNFFNRQSPRHTTARRAMCLFAIAATLTALATVSDAQIAPAQLLSARNATVVPPAGGNGDSVDAVVSPDGRFVVFSSVASDLAPGGSRQFFTDIFLRDQASNTTTMVTANLAGTGGGNGCSMYGQVSTNGQFVLFETQAGNLAAGASNWVGDVIVRNLAAGTNILVSVAANGGQANGRSYDATMTPDGRYVAFVSAANNLVSTTNFLPDVFLRDLVAGTTTLVSAAPIQPYNTYPFVATPQITPDGRYVAYFSSATGMVAGVSPTNYGEVYVYDSVAGTTTWASAAAAGMVQNTFGTSAPTNLYSYQPRLSADGRFVAFKSGANNTSGGTVILVYDTVAATTTLITTNALGSYPADENRYGPEMTPDGRFVAYANIEAPGGTNSSVHVWDSLLNTDILASTTGSGVPPNTISCTPVLSSDGRFVAFLSNATNLVANAVSSGFHIYLFNLQTGAIQLVDTDTNGVGSSDITGTFPSLSADGQTVVFNAPDGNLVNGDNNNALDVFARDTVAGTNELISRRNPASVSATGSDITRMTAYSISGDGRWLVFESFANDLVPNDTNGSCDVFLRDLWTGQITLVSAGFDGNPAQGGHSWSGVISANGRYVAFASAATNLTVNYASGTNFNIFRRDLQTGTTVLISVSTNGTDTASGYYPLSSCSYPVISADGRYVTFLSSAKNLSTNLGSGTFWRDVNSGTTVGFKSNNNQFLPSMSADGRYVAYQTNQFRIFDTQRGTDIYTNTTAFGSASISPDGSRILFGPNSGQISVIQISTGANLLSFASSVQVQNSGQWSSDGRYVAFVGTNSSAKVVYLCDLVTSNLTLVSSNMFGSGIPSGPSDMPVMSADGRFVAYRSYATNLVAGDLNPMPKIFLYDRLSGSNAIVSVSQTNSSPFPWISAPVISAGAQNVAFLNMSSDVISNDLNRVADAFAVRVLFYLQLAPVVTPGATTTLNWQALPTRTYAVQFKNNLIDQQWQTLSATIYFIGNEANVTMPADQPNRFYRVVETQ